METKPVKTAQDYQEALGEAGCLFDAEPNTPDSDRLEVLAMLVKACLVFQDRAPYLSGRVEWNNDD